MNIVRYSKRKSERERERDELGFLFKERVSSKKMSIVLYSNKRERERERARELSIVFELNT